MKYPLSEKYDTPELMKKIMGPNPLKLEEELLKGHRIPAGAVVCDLGSGQGLTSVFLAGEYGRPEDPEAIRGNGKPVSGGTGRGGDQQPV